MEYTKTQKSAQEVEGMSQKMDTILMKLRKMKRLPPRSTISLAAVGLAVLLAVPGLCLATHCPEPVDTTPYQPIDSPQIRPPDVAPLDTNITPWEKVWGDTPTPVPAACGGQLLHQ